VIRNRPFTRDRLAVFPAVPRRLPPLRPQSPSPAPRERVAGARARGRVRVTVTVRPSPVVPSPCPLPGGALHQKITKYLVVPRRRAAASAEPRNTGLWNMGSGLAAFGRAPE